MGTDKLTAPDLKKLAEWDTPTICNGLEHLSAEYRVKSFTVEQMQCFDPNLAPIVGYARTAMIRSMSYIRILSNISAKYLVKNIRWIMGLTSSR